MRWEKRGLVIAPGGRSGWAHSHAMLPVVEAPGHGDVRVYYATRDGEGRSQVTRVKLRLPPDGSAPVSTDEQDPVVAFGPRGAFDDRGASCSALVEDGGRHYLYYTGWSIGTTVPFYVFVGCAVSEDGGRKFEKVSPSPILERNRVDPFLTGHPAVLLDQGRWRMWYASGTGWSMVDGKPRHHYHVKYAESSDGIEWRRDGHVCIDYSGPDEYAIGRPFVVRDQDCYRMWYSYRGDAYRIGYAESADGMVWQRKDSEAGIGVSADGWDSKMVSYPAVFDLGGRRWMLYNGNDYGQTGIGLAQQVG